MELFSCKDGPWSLISYVTEAVAGAPSRKRDQRLDQPGFAGLSWRRNLLSDTVAIVRSFVDKSRAMMVSS